ncbi:protein ACCUMULATION AND REPLICATION OF CHLOROPLASTS 6, chloroplastic isoform X2 [Mercurialis annua]|uniref:protein ACCUMULATION AND REPLICATION OF CHLOROPLASTS 6, chloroplastic isoform X2 n=1 Tax=Mercurialis annua TaxID=3986 RepID=UPI00215F0342|nr:protein ACCUMULATION AND REPLICATION OF CHLOROPLASTS 6, chloroplastic isoform X2 [Mercurialis annua]
MEGMTYLGIRPLIPSSPPPKRSSRPTSSLSVTCSATKWADRLLSDFHFFATNANDSSDLHHSSSSTTTTVLAPPPPPPPLPPPERLVSIPLNFYQVLGAEAHFLGDGIKRAYAARVSKPPHSGFSEDTLISRRHILQAACETLSNSQSRREYNQALVDDELDTIITQVPLDKVPGALCVLEEAGETEEVLIIGENLLRERLPKSFKQDLVLVMALAYVEESRNAMAFTPPDFIRGSEMLERALKLLQEEGASRLAPDLLEQIDETLEEINPRRVLHLLALPLDDIYQMRRDEGLRGVRNILSAVGRGGAVPVAGGFTRDDFMEQAFLHMTAAEQINLYQAIPKDIVPEEFEACRTALALVAQAFVGKSPRHIPQAEALFHQLQQIKLTGQWSADSAYAPKQYHDIDYALALGLCSLLLGDLDECRRQLGLDSDTSPYRNPPFVDFMMKNYPDDDDNDLPFLCKLLETWLMEVVLPRFRDTNNIQVKLRDYYDDPAVLRYLESQERGGLAAAAAIVKIKAEKATTAVIDHVKAGAIQALQKVFPISQKGTRLESGGMNYPFSSVANEDYHESLDSDVIAEIPGEHSHAEVNEEELIASERKDAIIKFMSTGIAIGLVTLFSLKCLPVRTRSSIQRNSIAPAMASGTINCLH